MIKQNLHTHSSFSDGAYSPEELVVSAIEKGFTSLGFSEHAYAPYDTDCCIKENRIHEYLAEITRLKRKYEGQLEIFIGFECDSYYNTPKDGLDFTIGSTHYVFDKENAENLTIDYKPEIFEKVLKNVAGGDVKRLLEIYYGNVTSFALEYKPDIIGHLDLVKKLNLNNRYFEPKSAWYSRMLGGVCEKIAESGCIVEVNTGGIYRGYIDEPYPSAGILACLHELNVPVTVSSDAHDINGLDYWFNETGGLLKKIGYKSVKQLTSNGFVDAEIYSNSTSK